MKITIIYICYFGQNLHCEKNQGIRAEEAVADTQQFHFFQQGFLG